MATASRSGRVTLAANQSKTVIAKDLHGSTTAIYRFFNSGKEGATITIHEGAAANPALATLEFKDSIDVPVKKDPILVKAGAKEAEVVYDFLGLS